MGESLRRLFAGVWLVAAASFSAVPQNSLVALNEEKAALSEEKTALRVENEKLREEVRIAWEKISNVRRESRAQQVALETRWQAHVDKLQDELDAAGAQLTRVRLDAFHERSALEAQLEDVRAELGGALRTIDALEAEKRNIRALAANAYDLLRSHVAGLPRALRRRAAAVLRAAWNHLPAMLLPSKHVRGRSSSSSPAARRAIAPPRQPLASLPEGAPL